MSHPHPELSTPAPLAVGGLRIIPLGGLGEVGRNMTVFEYDDRLLIVDCGVLFPEDNHPGVDLILPDFDRDPGPARQGRGTGAHPRSRGPHRRDAVPPPRTRRHPPGRLRADAGAARLQAARAPAEGDRAPRGRARARRSPSAPSSWSSSPSTTRSPTRSRSSIRTGAGVVLHTGDFKMDQLPLDGRITDLNEFARLGDEGVDLFMTDSTNAEVPGFTTSEKDIAPVLDRVFHQVRPAHHRGVLRLAHPPSSAGARRGRRAQPQGGLRRSLDGPQHGDRQGARLPQRAGGRARRRQGAGRPPGPPPGPGLDRLPGRAAQSPSAGSRSAPTPSCTSRRATPSSWRAR